MRAKRSISSRLFLWLFILGLLALSIGGGGLYVEVRSIILAAVDHKLQSDLEIFTGLLHVEDGELEFEYAEATTGSFSIPRSGHYYQIFMDGELFAASVSLAGEQLELLPSQLVVHDPEMNLKTYTAIGPADEPLRAMTRAVIFAGHPTRLIIAHSLADSVEMLHRLRNSLLLFGGLGTLLIALLGWKIGRRSLQPLREFSTDINRISEKTLDQRIDAQKQYQELSSLAAAFNAMLDRLQQSLAAREELLSDVSHELKTPVAVIRSHCDIYLQQERPAAEYVEALEVIRKTTESMGQKINRLLSIAQSEAELMNATGFQPIDLSDCLRKARLTVETLARERQIEFSAQLTPGLQIYGHAERLTEAFSNLLENAVKYNLQGGSVRIIAKRQAEQAQISIEDTGCGIAPEETERIFERFYRGNGTDQAEGTGLGLGLVKTIIDAHHGRIEVSSRQGGGSCFTIELPLT